MKLDDNLNSDISEDEEQYSNLAKAVSLLDNAHRVKAATRKETSSTISEFHLPSAGQDGSNLVNVHELAAGIRGIKPHIEVGKKVKSVVKQAKTLPRPLVKPVEERIQRSIGYKNVSSSLKKWDAVVARNRFADHMSFPLQQGRVSLKTSHEFLSKFKNQTPLEIEMEKLLNEGGKKDEEEKDVKENLEFPLTLEEILEKRKELAELRAKMSYKEAKAYRQSKIKSKKYHRILKREKIKQQLKEFEQLQKSDPEAALRKLAELDRSRAEERASLRHKNTGKWAKNMAVRAKYDKESRQVLAEQLKLSRELTERVKNINSEDEASDQEIEKITQDQDIVTTNDNPWAIKVTSEVTNLLSNCRKYWENINKAKELNKNGENKIDEKSENSSKTGLSGNVKGSGTFENSSSHSENLIDVKDGTETVNVDDLALKTINLANEKDRELTFEKEKTSVVPTNDVHRTKKLEKEFGKVKVNDLKKVTIKRKVKQMTKKDDCKSTENSSEKNRKSVSKILKKQAPLHMNSDQKGKRGKKDSSEERMNNTAISSQSVGQSARTTKKKSDALEKERVRNAMNSISQVHSTSGAWTVTSTNDKPVSASAKRKSVLDIEDIFEDLEEKLKNKAKKKIKKIEKKLNKETRKPKKKKIRASNNDFDLSLKKNPKTMRPDVDKELLETTGGEEAPVSDNPYTVGQTLVQREIPENGSAPEIDPNKFVSVKPKKLNTKLPDNLTGDDDYLDDEEKAQEMNIMEAFDGDDVMEEFQEMKREEEEKTKLEVPGELPGWGSWGGTGIKPKKRKTALFNVPKLPPRKDHNKKDLIINEKANAKIVEHMVKDVPFPFKSVGAFEANIRNPLGREWVPESAHRKFIEKPVETLLGTIINPMDENELARLKKEKKSLFKGIKKTDFIKR